MTTTKNNEHKKLNAPNKQEQNQTCLDAAEREGLRPKGNIPNLRFPEFQEEWEKCKLGTLTAKVGSGSTPKGGNAVYTSTGHCFVRSQNVGMGYLILDDVAHINDGIHQKHKATELKEDDVLLNITGASIGRTAIATKEIEGGNVNQHVCIIRANSKVSPKFLCNYIQTKKIQNYIQSLQTGGSREGLNFEQIRSFPISLPNIAEQNKIAQLFDKLNERIATQNKIIEDLKKLKCAIIEKVYSEIQGKEYSYGQLFDVVNERNKQMEYSNILSANQEKGMVNRDDLNLDIQFERSNINTYKIVKKGDYVIHLRSFQGGFAFSDKLGVCSPAYTILRPNSILEYGYLSNYFTSQRFIKSLALVTYGIRDGRSINVEEWLRMKITIPPKEHQQYIVKVIGTFERKIEDEEAYAAQLSKQKQYLLRQMFI